MQMREGKKEDRVARSVVFSQAYVAATGWGTLNVVHTLHKLYQCFGFAEPLDKLQDTINA